jgi:hypothetical protein
MQIQTIQDKINVLAAKKAEAELEKLVADFGLALGKLSGESHSNVFVACWTREAATQDARVDTILAGIKKTYLPLATLVEQRKASKEFVKKVEDQVTALEELRTYLPQ